MINNYFLRARELYAENERDVALFAIFFLIATTSFAIGYLSAGEFSRADIIIEQCSALDLVEG